MTQNTTEESVSSDHQTKQIRRYLMSCPECGTVVERLYSEIAAGTEKDEHCPSCESWEPFKYVMEVPDDDER